MIYKFIYPIFYLLSLLPFWILYILAGFAYLIVYKLIGYRTRVVRNNLRTSFPEKSQEELKKIEKQFYHWLCDYFFETLKLLSISKKELDKRFVITNPEVITDCFKEGQNVAAILGHYCNWEWLTRVGKDFNNEKRKVGIIYHPLYNKVFDKLLIDIRTSESSITVPKKDILRQLLTFKKEGIMSILGYVSDQSPKWENIHLWLPFLNHDTPVFTGGERIMRKMNDAIFYVVMKRPKRGYYTCTYNLITNEPNSLPEHEITRIFFQMLEKTVQNAPQYYLWSHNRWKRTHEEYNRRFGDRKDKYADGNNNEK